MALTVNAPPAGAMMPIPEFPQFTGTFTDIGIKKVSETFIINN